MDQDLRGTEAASGGASVQLLIAEHQFLRQLLTAARAAAEQVLSEDASVGQVLFGLLEEVREFLDRHLREEAALLPALQDVADGGALKERLLQAHQRQERLLAALTRWLDRDAQTLARQVAAFAEEIEKAFDAEEGEVFDNLAKRPGAAASVH